MKHKIKLYQFETCPFCIKVRNKLGELGLEYGKIEVPRDKESEERKFLFEKSNVRTVPVIEIDGKFTGESEDIIEKLQNLEQD